MTRHHHSRASSPLARRREEDKDLASFTTDQIATAMELASVDRRLIYAFRKTGFIPTEETLDLFSAADLAEWDAAIAEYEAQQAAGAAAKGVGA